MSQLEAARELRDALADAGRGLVHSAEAASSAAARSGDRARLRLDNVVIARLERQDAPLLVIVGGSTGSGKSTLVNALVGEQVTRAGVIRPTTHTPVVVSSANNRPWVLSDALLPHLAKKIGEEESQSRDEVRIVESGNLPEGFLLLDAPDIDSVDSSNRQLAGELLDSADLWIFVTTATRYADALAWHHLYEAAERGLNVAVVLNRIPTGAADRIGAHLRQMMRERGLGDAPIFFIDEKETPDTPVSSEDVASLRAWLSEIESNRAEKQRVARAALAGAMQRSLEEAEHLEAEVHAQHESVEWARERLDALIAQAASHVSENASGEALRADVNDRVLVALGSWEWTNSAMKYVSRLGGRLKAAIRGEATPAEAAHADVTSSFAALIEDQLHTTWTAAVKELEGQPSFSWAVRQCPSPAPQDVTERATQGAREWARHVAQLIHSQAPASKKSGRLVAGSINVAALGLMVLTFSMTGGLTGVEVGIAGSAALLSQTLLESLFGAGALTSLVSRARASMEETMRAEASRMLEPLQEIISSQECRGQWEKLRDAVQVAREEFAL